MKRAHNHWRLLISHECRLIWRQWRLDKWASGSGGHVALAILLAFAAHLAVWIFVALLPHKAPVSAEAVAWTGALTLAFAIFMLATALSHSVEALFERNDLDLLFAAPISPRPVLVTRTLTVACATLLIHGLYLLPVANMAMLTGRTWLWPLYVVAPLMALLSAALALLLSLVLIELLGARRTRTLVQVIAVSAGAMAFLFMQLGPRAMGSIDLSASSSLPVRALNWVALPLLGDARAISALAAAAIALCAFSWTRLDRVFLRGSQETMTGSARRAPRRKRARAQRASRHWMLNVCIKEWRTIVRDSLLLTRIGLTFAYMAPLLILVWRSGTSSLVLETTVAAASCVFIASLFSQQLAMLTVNMEDAPQLLLASPRSVVQLLTAKAMAAAAPAAALAFALLCLIASVVSPVVLAAAPVAAAAAWSGASIVAARVRLIPRVEFGKRGGQPDFETGLLVFFVGLLLAGAGALVVTRFWWAALPVLILPAWASWSAARKLSRTRADTLIHA